MPVQRRLRRHLGAALLAAAMLLSGCDFGEPQEAESAGDGAATTADGQDAGDRAKLDLPAPTAPLPEGPSALQVLSGEGLPEPAVDPSRISTLLPPDGIPSIDEPVFLDVADADFLTDVEPVVALEIGGDARAYPVQILTWHEIVNDVVGGVPVAVSYCPLCNSAIAYERLIDGNLLDFGTSGKLYQSALVMYDRQTESLWSHFSAEAIAGLLTGRTLPTLPMATVSWADFRAAHPEGLVLSTDTGHSRDYGRNPYPGYDDVGTSPFAFDGVVDGRLAAKERVVGFGDGADAQAVQRATLAEERVVHVDDVVLWVVDGTASALDADEVQAGRDIGAVGVFAREVDGRTLTFRADRLGSTFSDDETGSTWDVLGHATAGPMEGTRLTPVIHVDTFWFAWAAFQPETTLAG